MKALDVLREHVNNHSALSWLWMLDKWTSGGFSWSESNRYKKSRQVFDGVKMLASEHSFDQVLPYFYGGLRNAEQITQFIKSDVDVELAKSLAETHPSR